jgi:hypothetical protein
MTPQAARAYVKQWVQTGQLLEELRWRELAALDDARALRASDALVESAMRVRLPPGRREWSGLVEQQALFRRRA